MQTMIPSQATEIKDVHQQTVQPAQPMAQGGQMVQGQPMVFQPMVYQVRMNIESNNNGCNLRRVGKAKSIITHSSIPKEKIM